ncbi:TRAP transporter permease [Niveispirillum sp.]|uniref:TRAP transporter permease n=1 Tax=Niveispirillum sp. TaxID=1917217 RepID=UPI001B51005E|nr:TRAP transporter permease [Niveispirillum sp.]MBP7336089.1 TRAP transporter permease [Niveispirillum sp.]
MTNAPIPVIDEDAVRRAVEKDDPTSAITRLTAGDRRVIFAIGVAFALFQLWTATFNPLSSLVVRSVHVGFLLLMAFLLIGARDGGRRERVPVYDWFLGGLSFLLGLYHWVFEHDLILRSGTPTDLDLWVGALNTLLVAEAARRIMGWGLPLLCLIFIPYAMFGQYMPDLLAHRGYDLDQVIEQLHFSTEGIYGTPTFVSSTFIFLFILFGAFLEKAGVIQLFNDLSMALVGRRLGGAAKVSVVSSGFMGMVNGSGVANVLTTGQFTIPMMKRFGYSAKFAGALEATASMGGQIMPPVMGAAAFIMAETLGISYLEVCKAAAIPAVLYFASAYWMAHLEAERAGLRGLPESECPKLWPSLRRGWHLLLPLVALVTLLLSGRTPLFAGVVGIAGTVVLMMGLALVAQVGPVALRVAFWLGLGLGAWGLTQLGLRTEQMAMVVIALLALPCLLFRSGRDLLRALTDALADGARAAVAVSIACALVGILIGMLTLTGLASGLAGIIVDLSGGNLLLALVLTMMACIILGTGLPTTANYIITASIAAPALQQLGVPLIVSHMFCFYFGIMADLTPPVALAALAASPIARAGHMEIAWLATRIGVAGYLVPFMAVFDPALMLQTGDWLDTAYMVVKALVGIGMLGIVTIGHYKTKLKFWELAWALTAAVLLVLAMPLTDEAGFVLSALFLGRQILRGRRLAPV